MWYKDNWIIINVLLFYRSNTSLNWCSHQKYAQIIIQPIQAKDISYKSSKLNRKIRAKWAIINKWKTIKTLITRKYQRLTNPDARWNCLCSENSQGFERENNNVYAMFLYTRRKVCIFIQEWMHRKGFKIYMYICVCRRCSIVYWLCVKRESLSKNGTLQLLHKMCEPQRGARSYGGL